MTENQHGKETSRLTETKEQNRFKEETATEYFAPTEIGQNERANREANNTTGRGYGYVALALAVLSLFAAPVLFGLGGIILGVMARNRGATGLGTWAVIIGTLSVIAGILLAPFF